LPAQIAHTQRVVVLDPERSRIVEGAVADHRYDWQPQRRCDRDGLHRVHPAHARGAHEHAGADGRGVLADLELGVLALGDYVLALELAVGDELGDRLHDAVVGADRVRSRHLDVGQAHRLGDGLRAGHQLLFLLRLLALGGHRASPPLTSPRCRR
jgi:hypothetical protein